MFFQFDSGLRPGRWFDAAAAFQVAWVLLGLVALRRTRLFVPLAVTAGLAAAGTGVVLLTDSPTAALLFPWRVSAVLVPVATAVLAAWVIGRAGGVSPLLRPHDHPPRLVTGGLRPPLAGLVLFAVLAAAAVYAFGLGYREPASEDAALAFVLFRIGMWFLHGLGDQVFD